MKVIVCGGRDYNDKDEVFNALDRAHAKKRITVVIHGGATGADSLAEQWCIERGVNYARVPAMWERQGNKAGPVRNAIMLTFEPHVLIAFPGGTGTGLMIRLALAAHVIVWEPCK